ncbi:MAG: glycosyltransferase family 4 protein [Bacteroidota bacterium]
MSKLSDEEIRALEAQNLFPRVSMLEDSLDADVLDERYLYEQPPGIRRWIYRWIPAGLAQLLEVLFIHRKYDVILSQSERVGLPLAFLMKYLRIRIPHIMIISRITSMDEKKSRQKKWFLKHTKDVISKFLIWSSNQRNIIIEELGVPSEDIILIKRGTDQRFWSPIQRNTDQICSVGMEMRDYPTLVKALEPLDIPCHIAVSTARGQLFDTVKRLYAMDELPTNISVGRRPYVQLRELYARCRFTVVPLLSTDSDNGLTAILESMAMGKPVICSRTEGQVDIIEDGVTGLFVPQGDPKALREAILELWNDPERAQAMGRAARTFIESGHTMEQFVASITNEVQKVKQVTEVPSNSVTTNQYQLGS